MAEFPRGTVTFLFTDIEGSTRLLKQLGERYGSARADHHRLLRAAYQEHEGQEIDTQGDAFFVAFQRAKDAVAAAAAAQRALAAHDWPGGVPLRVRMGIHTAEPSVSEEGYLGLGVHRAARICSAGHGGQILLSQATVALLEDEVLPGLELRDLGRHQLKDLDRPERIYQLVLPDLPDTFPPLKAELGHATPFEGREGELAEAAAAAVARRWYRTRVGVSTLALVAVAALVAGAGLVFTGGSSGLSRIDSDSAGLIDSNSNEIKKQVAVGSSPGAIAAGAGAIWVAAGDGISRIDPEANLVTQRISLSRPPSGVVFGGDAVWVVSSEERSLRKISPTATQPGASIRVGNGAGGVAVGDDAVWVANRLDDTVSKVPTGPGHTRAFPAGLTPSGVAVGKNAVWVSNEAAGTVSRLDPRSGSLTAIPVGNGPTGIAVGSGGVWVANSLDDTVSRIDPGRNRVLTTIPVGRGPSTVETGPDSVWVANRFGGTVSRIDPKTNLVTNTTRVGNSPGGIAFTGDGVWVSARGPLTSHRGGVLRVVGSQGDLDSVDPGATYKQEGWAIAIMTNDGLLTFKRVAGPDSGQLVPDLAKSIPRPSGDDKTYAFELRQGIHYSNGRLVQASDIRRGLERFFEIHSSAAPFFKSIEGAPACARNPKHCDLRRGVVANDEEGTVTFHLSAPDPEFLYQLALPFAAAVPAGTPSRIAKTGSLVPATGPYMVGPRSVLDRRVELVRNPRFHEWSPAAQPNGFPDRIILDYTKQEGAQVTAVERNQADLMPRSIPLERVEELRTRYSERVHVNTAASVVMAFLNVRTHPFDHRSVRQALAYAVDHRKTIRAGLGPSQALPTCQILPPNFPSYRPYCPYTLNPSGSGTWIAPNLPKAKELIKSSGTRGMEVKVWAWTDPSGFQPPIRAGRYLKALLNRLGYHASLKIVTAPKTVPAAAGYYLSVVQDSRTRAQIGTTGWGADYPAASSFIRPLLSCQAFHPARPEQTNVAEFCDKSIDRKITHALQAQARDPSKAARLWAEIDHDLVDEAPVVPLLNQKVLGFVSKRVGNYQYNPQWGVLLDQLWVR